MDNKSNILFDSFSDLPDFRKSEKIEHNLIEIIALAICAMVAGCDDWTEIEDFCNIRIDWFKKFLELKNGIPSHDTFGRVFSMINPDKFRDCFIKWINKVKKITDGEIVAIDGKTIRRSFDKSSKKSAIHMVSAWASNAGLVLGQIKVNEKSNEITAIPKLLELLALKGCIVTIDAMGCQKDIAKKIIESKADYVLSLKGNQGTLLEDIKLFYEDCVKNNLKNIEHDYHRTFDNDHGRLETREYYITNNVDWLNQKNDWQGLKTIGMVKSIREIDNNKTEEIRYFISSIEQNAKKFAKAVRSHWGIENSLHWVLDVSFREDESRVRKDYAPENLAVLRHITLGMLKQDTTVKKSIKSKRLRACADQNYLEKIVFSKF
jgi:predicted transposase YbfD/YdcC